MFSKSALTAEDMLRRYHWAVHIANLRHRAQWYHDKVIFTDICNSILPTNEKKANEQALARKNKRLAVPRQRVEEQKLKREEGDDQAEGLGNEKALLGARLVPREVPHRVHRGELQGR